VRLTPALLEGTVVRMEPLTLDHVDALCEVGLDPAIWALTPNRMSSEAEMRDWVRQALAEQQGGTALPFATVERASGRVVGSTRFGSYVPEHQRVEIGWTWIAPPWQRTAVNTEAKLLMLTHAFETIGCRRVELKTSSRNERSQAAILRIGATREGTLRQHMINPDGSSRDTVYFSILDGEWADVKARLLEMLQRH